MRIGLMGGRPNVNSHGRPLTGAIDENAPFLYSAYVLLGTLDRDLAYRPQMV